MTTSTEEKPRESATAALVAYHWMITIQWTNRDGLPCMRTRTGTVAVTPGTSRNEVAGEIYANVTEDTGPDGTVVLFFSLELDAL
jgi:hypothetical protein